ncbi:hypothetical protein RND81_13G195600 [Saponaria officinalis]|uniref:Uncharacterized protein n=1 Tax=Saponaria officinalis TaxID=3572 RepID=A0AAW1H2G6_SAPOF
MVAVYNKDLLSWYLITLKLRDTLNNAPKQIEGSLNKLEPRLGSDSLRVIVNREIQNQDGLFESESPREPEWVISIKERLEEAVHDDVAGSWAKICIYRVPHFLRDQGDDKAYVPQVVSIGPYHRGAHRLLAMDRHKWRALYQLLDREKQDVMLYVNAVKELEERTRSCYEGPLNVIGNEFVEMMVLDGCFVIELLRGYVEGFENLGYERNDPIFAVRGMMYSIRRDMMMIENQLPLFVLDKLFSLQLGNSDKKGIVSELALIFFDPLSPIDEPLTARQKIKLESSMHANEVQFHPLSDQSGLHCLDLFRRSLLRKGPEPVLPKYWFRKWSRRNLVVDQRRTQLIHCVTDLKESGIKFKKRKTDRFWDIKFKNGVLHIPRLLVHDGTKALFLNLVAYEQSHLDCTNDITAYVVFMDNLINSAHDVSYLHYCGILEHWLGNDVDVADMFNHLCREVVFDINDSYLSKVSEEINAYYRRRWNGWKASLKHKYFHNPWAIISFLAAVFLILLTSAQTYYSVYGYYSPPH